MNQLKNIDKKAYIFDLFHTLTDLESSWAKLPSTSDYLGIDKNIWNDLLQFDSYERLCGFEKDEYKIIRGIVDKVDPTIPEIKVRRAVQLRKERFGRALANIPTETVRSLESLKLKGKKLGLLSNADVMEIALWDRSPICGLFDSTIFSCFAGCAKPDREIYAISMNELGVVPDQALFIGDGGSDELHGAKDAGITTVMMTGIIQALWPEKIPDRRRWADYEIQSIAELL